MEAGLLRDIELMEAHASEALKIAARLKAKLQPVSTGRSKKKGLTAAQIAKIIGKRRSNILKKTISQ